MQLFTKTSLIKPDPHQQPDQGNTRERREPSNPYAMQTHQLKPGPTRPAVKTSQKSALKSAQKAMPIPGPRREPIPGLFRPTSGRPRPAPKLNPDPDPDPETLVPGLIPQQVRNHANVAQAVKPEPDPPPEPDPDHCLNSTGLHDEDYGEGSFDPG